MTSHTLGRLAAGGTAALAALCSLSVATSADAAPGADCPAYASTATAATSLSVSPGDLSTGESFTATATITSSSADLPVAGGTVDFRYAGQSATVPVGESGTASTTFTAERGTFDVTATYSGRCLAGSAVIGVSAATVPVVAGVESSGGGGGSPSTGSNRPPAEVAGVEGLASTGFDSRTELLGLLGLGLVGAGAVTMMVRRRSHS